MLRTKLFGTAGTFLVLSSLLLGTQFWSFQTRLLMIQAGILAMGLGFYFRLTEGLAQDPLAELYDIETGLSQ
jgi:hypothetical protein